MNEVAVGGQVENLHRQAVSRGLPVSLAWVRDLLQRCGGGPVMLASLGESFFKSDLAVSGIGTLPAGILLQHNSRLQGIHVLQVVRYANIAEPSAAGDTGSGRNRLFKFELTDGKSFAYAIEYRRLRQLDGVRLRKYAKVVVMGSPVIRRGLILLQDNNFRLVWSGDDESPPENNQESGTTGTASNSSETHGRAVQVGNAASTDAIGISGLGASSASVVRQREGEAVARVGRSAEAVFPETEIVDVEDLAHDTPINRRQTAASSIEYPILPTGPNPSLSFQHSEPQPNSRTGRLPSSVHEATGGSSGMFRMQRGVGCMQPTASATDGTATLATTDQRQTVTNNLDDGLELRTPDGVWMHAMIESAQHFLQFDLDDNSDLPFSAEESWRCRVTDGLTYREIQVTDPLARSICFGGPDPVGICPEGMKDRLESLQGYFLITKQGQEGAAKVVDFRPNLSSVEANERINQVMTRLAKTTVGSPRTIT